MFEIKMPTPDELHRMCSRQYEKAGATYLDNWPKAWRELSMPTELVPLRDEHVAEMWSAHDGVGEVPNLTKLAAQIDDVCGWSEKFIRLNSRSPKDVIDRPVTCAGRQALLWLIASERTMDDLSMLGHAKRSAFVAIRDLVWISPPNELRCFVKDGSMVAVTQYHYSAPQKQWLIEKNRDDVRSELEAYWKEFVHPPSPLSDYVFDVTLRRGDKPLLIEINPYGLSDPCAAGSYEAIERGGFFFTTDGKSIQQ